MIICSYAITQSPPPKCKGGDFKSHRMLPCFISTFTPKCNFTTLYSGCHYDLICLNLNFYTQKLVTHLSRNNHMILWKRKIGQTTVIQQSMAQWRNVMFSDKAKFCFWDGCLRVWMKIGDRLAKKVCPDSDSISWKECYGLGWYLYRQIILSWLNRHSYERDN